VEFLEIAKLVGPPVLGGIVGIVSGYLKSSARVTALETWKESHEKAFKDYKLEIDKRFENLNSAWKLEFADQKEEFERRVSELKREIKELDDAFDRFARASHHDFADNEEFTRFVEEMHRQWKVVERTLGQIEGWMKHPQMPTR
jgi:hypothetical protein